MISVFVNVNADCQPCQESGSLADGACGALRSGNALPRCVRGPRSRSEPIYLASSRICSISSMPSAPRRTRCRCQLTKLTRVHTSEALSRIFGTPSRHTCDKERTAYTIVATSRYVYAHYKASSICTVLGNCYCEPALAAALSVVLSKSEAGNCKRGAATGARSHSFGWEEARGRRTIR